MVEAYPLQWPIMRSRTKEDKRERARFGHRGWQDSYSKPVTFEIATRHMYDELERLGAKSITLSSNLKLRNDGIPYSNQGRVEDPGIAVYFFRDDKELCFSCDKWDRAEDNIRAVAKSIEAIRGLNRWGSKDMVEAAFSGFKALPAPGGDCIITGAPDYFCGCHSKEEVISSYKRFAKDLHPDGGGSNILFVELQRQYNIALSQIQREGVNK